ncbi:MAG: lipoyl synthase [Calditrichia bacterium]
MSSSIEKTATSPKKPSWLKVRLSGGEAYREVRQLIQKENLHTVCTSAHCPNVGDCWSRRTATFMILGDICTRNCHFCAVRSGKPTGVDSEEPLRVAKAVERLKLRHAVITSVTRDDLPDGGASVFVQAIEHIRRQNKECSIEVLIPDFLGNMRALESVFQARPDILNHNLEVVPRLYPRVRPGARYQRSLSILAKAKQAELITKTGIMVGLGENRSELLELFQQLVAIDLDILTIGQYLQPSSAHLAVQKFYTPEEFREFKIIGERMGIGHVESGPLVRSSFHADEQMEKLTNIHTAG